MIVIAGVITPIGMDVNCCGVNICIDDEVGWQCIRVKEMRHSENILSTRKQYARVVEFPLQGEFENLGGH